MYVQLEKWTLTLSAYAYTFAHQVTHRPFPRAPLFKDDDDDGDLQA